MSFGEWIAAVEGLKQSLGIEIEKLSWDDFSHLEHRKGPTRSIRDGS